jgi:hypothetical protein
MHVARCLGEHYASDSGHTAATVQAAHQLLSSALADAAQVMRACTALMQLSEQYPTNQFDAVFGVEAFLHNIQEVKQLMPELSLMHPALKHNDGLDWVLERHASRSSYYDIPRDESRYNFPTPFSLLRTFPPAPDDPSPWATFYRSSAPMRPLVAVDDGLIQPGELLEGEGNVARVCPDHKLEPPGHPASGASAQEVAVYVCQTESQLGPAFHVLAPVAAVLTQRPGPWVSHVCLTLMYTTQVLQRLCMCRRPHS